MTSLAGRISVVAIAAGILTGCALSPQAREARELSNGKRELQKKNGQVAVIYFKRAVEAQPRDAEAYFQLALAYLAQNDPDQAVSALRKATELSPKHAAAQLKLAELMASSAARELVEEAQKRSQDVLSLMPGDAEALDVLAFTELRLGQPESAEAHLEQAVRQSPGDLRSYIVLAQTRLARKDAEGAGQALEQAAAQSPKSPEPRYYLGGFYLALGRAADAEREYRASLAIDPKHGPSLLSLAALEARAGRRQEAEQTYRQLSALADKQYKPLHAMYLLQTGRGDEAVAELQMLMKSDPSDRSYRTALVASYLTLGRAAEAEKILTAALRNNALDADALLQRSRIYLAGRHFDEAEADLGRVLHFRVDSAEAHYLLSKVHQGRGQSALQQEELGQALRLDPKILGIRLELAQYLIGHGGAQSALQLLDEARPEQRDSADVILKRNWALIVLGRTSDARKGVDRIISVRPEAVLQDGILKLAARDYAGAGASAQRVLAQSPDDTRALRLLAIADSAQRQKPGSFESVRRYAASHPRSAAVQQFLGETLMSSGDAAGARKAFEAAIAASPALVEAGLSLAGLDLADGKMEDGRKRLSVILAAHPDSFPGRLLFAQLEQIEGHNPAAIDQYRKAVSLDEKNAFALNGLAYSLAESRQADEALRYAQRAKELAPYDASVDDTLGWTYFQKGMYPIAVKYLEGAIAKDGTPRRKYHLAMAYFKAGDAKRGREALEEALKVDPNMPEAQAARQIAAGHKD